MGDPIHWVSCKYEEAEQYRWRYRTKSVGLVSPWSDWISSGYYPPAPSPMAMSKRYEYRKRFVYEPFGGKATITFPTAPGKTMDGMEMVKHVFSNLTAEQRVEVFNGYCCVCGSDNPMCPCEVE